MKAVWCSLVLAICFFRQLPAKDELQYPVSQIPENLKAGMYAVLREKQERFEIISINQSKYYCRQVITLLNPQAKRFATTTLAYSKLTRLTIVTAKVYSAEGHLIKRLKSHEIQDFSAFDGFSLFSDNRLKRMDLTQAVYPYTVEIEYELEYGYLYGIPAFEPYFDDEVSTQRHSYELRYPVALKPKHRCIGMAEPQKITEGTMEKLIWRQADVVPDKFEPYAPAVSVPHVIFSPNLFEYSGYRGSMETWEQYGAWQNLLNRGRGTLDEATRSHVKRMTAHLTTNEEKAKAVYEYMQSKTRYVSIQEGIGGLQPFAANEVDALGYGDCKALSNYYIAMLKELGIAAYYTKVRAGRNEQKIVDFPSHQTNHIIVGIPNGSDTLWAECTSQRAPFGYMGSFTGDRWALMVTESGGKLVRTPSYKAHHNQKRTQAEVQIDINGNAIANIHTTYTGLMSEEGGLETHVHAPPADQKTWIEQNTRIPAFVISSFELKGVPDKIPVVHVTIALQASRYSSVSGKRLFLTPNLLNRSTFLPPKTEKRKHPIGWPLACTVVDTITYRFPENLYPEFVPAPVEINTRFGHYQNQVEFDQGKIIYTRSLTLRSGEFPAESYQDMIEFYKEINKADNMKLVFLNKS